jgi:hypothetical protein
MSVKSGYAYFALQSDSLKVVCGEEPEFEATGEVASSFGEFLQMLVAEHQRLVRWV